MNRDDWPSDGAANSPVTAPWPSPTGVWAMAGKVPTVLGGAGAPGPLPKSTGAGLSVSSRRPTRLPACRNRLRGLASAACLVTKNEHTAMRGIAATAGKFPRLNGPIRFNPLNCSRRFYCSSFTLEPSRQRSGAILILREATVPGLLESVSSGSNIAPSRLLRPATGSYARRCADASAGLDFAFYILRFTANSPQTLPR